MYLRRCLSHLIAQGVEVCLIDNASTDETRSIAEEFEGPGGVFRIETQPYEGFFDLTGQLKQQEVLACEIDADWFIHQDADEILEAPKPGWTLGESIAMVDASSYNAINFDEFVFVPLEGEDFEGSDYVAEMERYYFFEPFSPRLVRAWKRTSSPPLLAESGGHLADFPGIRVFPSNFILRHYIALSRRHILRKYGELRSYAIAEVDRGWHGWRARFRAQMIRFPEASQLKSLASGGNWDKSNPMKRHLFVSEGS